ncbi:MAG TPA: hypothetical protein VFU88_00460 [Ktedonobacterales bacterium]|nr:hypothetical protein [Ktedonobacterales bacterium]
MVDELRRAFELAQQCPDEEQRRIAQMVLEELEDQQWEESPAVRAAIEEARAQIAAGDYVTLDELDRMRRGSN